MVELRVGVYEAFKNGKETWRRYGFGRNEGDINYCVKTPEELGMIIWKTFQSPKVVNLRPLGSIGNRGTSSKLISDDFDFTIERDLSQLELRKTLEVISREQKR